MWQDWNEVQEGLGYVDTNTYTRSNGKPDTNTQSDGEEGYDTPENSEPVDPHDEITKRNRELLNPGHSNSAETRNIASKTVSDQSRSEVLQSDSNDKSRTDLQSVKGPRAAGPDNTEKRRKGTQTTLNPDTYRVNSTTRVYQGSNAREERASSTVSTGGDIGYDGSEVNEPRKQNAGGISDTQDEQDGESGDGDDSDSDEQLHHKRLRTNQESSNRRRSDIGPPSSSRRTKSYGPNGRAQYTVEELKQGPQFLNKLLTKKNLTRLLRPNIIRDLSP